MGELMSAAIPDLTILAVTNARPQGLASFYERSRRSLLLFVCCVSLSYTIQAQVTISAGSGAGSFQCQEGAAPSAPSTNQDILWCDSSHWMMMMSNTTPTPTSILGVTGAEEDNTILISAVDATPNFNPSFLTLSGAPTTKVTLNGATTNFVAFIDGQRVIVNSNLISTNSLTNGSINFVYLTKDATLVAATTLPPVYGRTAPTCPGSPLQFWFNTATRKMNSCSNGGSYVLNPVLFLGVVALNGSGSSLGIAHEPWHLSPYTRLREFGNGSDGFNNVTGSVTHDGWKQYSALEINGGTLSHSQCAPPNASGLWAYSQNPVLITNSGKIDLAALGRSGGSGGSSAAGGPGNAGGWGGAAGGGGGGTSTAGGNGGGRSLFNAQSTANGGAGGGSSAGVGSVGAPGGSGPSSGIPPLTGPPILLCGPGGGGGGGDGTNAGGGGGKGGGGLYLKAPSIVAVSGVTIDADAQAGVSPSTGNTGGGGGGGVIVLDGWFVENAVTITEAAGANGVHHGTNSADGGDGTAGFNQVIQRQ